MKLMWGAPPTGPTALLLWKRRFAQRFAVLIQKKKVTVPELALRSGLPIPYLNRLLKARIYPTFKARSMIGKALGVTEEYLVG